MGKLTFHRSSLAEVIEKGRAAGLLPLQEQIRDWIEGIELTLRSGRKHVFLPGDWRRLSGGLTLLSDAEARKPLDFPSQEEKYRAFREFLYGSHSVPDWTGFARGFAFRRRQFVQLYRAVSGALDSTDLQEEPFLLAGRSGVGKTVAMADLAVQIRRDRWPVLYFSRNYIDLDYGLIETVCTPARAARKGVDPARLGWDDRRPRIFLGRQPPRLARPPRRGRGLSIPPHRRGADYRTAGRDGRGGDIEVPRAPRLD